VFNVCAGRSTTVLGLARTLAEACGREPVIHHALGRAGEVRHSLGAPEAAHSTLGLNEPLPLLDGLREVVTWMRAGRPLLAAQLVPGE
jgi:UDP-glucose 4-epimerase